MSGTRVFSVLPFFTLMLIAISAPCYAWLYDGGNPSISGPQVKDGTSTVWVSQSFTLDKDSWVTSFGAAVARGFGTSEMGFDLYLTDKRFDGSMPVIASGVIAPSGVGYAYRYVNLLDPVKLVAGQKYYLTMAPNSNNFMGTVSWSYKQDADYGLGTGNYGETWFQYSHLSFCVRVDGYEAVPETDAWVTLVLGSLALVGMPLLKQRFGSPA